MPQSVWEVLPIFDLIKKRGRISDDEKHVEDWRHECAEEHPDEVLAVIEDKTEAMVRELEQQEREASRALKARSQKRGIASLCIGGGEATAIAVELM